ncbi:MAG: hypothetical protein ACXVC7_07905 [Bacteroidia bacterium]
MKTLIKLRRILICFIVLLIVSGLTAFPVRTEIEFLITHLNSFPVFFQAWILQLKASIDVTPEVVLYGTDWLAFAHIIIALFFIPVFIDPVKHKANLIIGMIACVAVFPLAFICGPIRSIPFFHRLIDCAFGIGGFIMLYWIYRLTNRIEKRINI